MAALREARIGVEIELLLALRYPLSGSSSDLRGFGKEVVQKYNLSDTSSHPKMQCYIDDIVTLPNFLKWAAKDDMSLHCDVKDYHPIEMVSPVLKFDPGSQWRSSVQQFWDTMRRISFIKTNRTCGTHVHLSPPKGQSWDIHWVKCICRTAIYFEEAIEVLVPPPRRGNEYCRSNSVDNPLLHGKPLGEIFDLIEACSNIPDVVRLLNPDTRDYAFNFRNLDSSLSSRPQTVEFRRPPGVTTAAECLSWTQFTVSFIMGGASSGTTTQLSQYSGDVNGLKKFIEASSVPGALESQLMSPIFENKSGSLKITPYRDLANETKEA